MHKNRPVISLLVPFRDTGDRRAQFDWLQQRWKTYYPHAEIIVEGDDGKDPFSKTIAINRCYERSTSDVIAMLDADVWLDPHILTAAATTIRDGKHHWIQPCNTVVRLNETYTRWLVERDPVAKWNPTAETLAGGVERTTGVVGLVAVWSRAAFEGAGGMDPRFRGWGWEDNAFNDVMKQLYGPAPQWSNIVYHLWHPRGLDNAGRPTWPGQTERNAKLGNQYKQARNRPRRMLQLTQEVSRLTGIHPQ